MKNNNGGMQILKLTELSDHRLPALNYALCIARNHTECTPTSQNVPHSYSLS